jgi:hypothetical protein
MCGAHSGAATWHTLSLPLFVMCGAHSSAARFHVFTPGHVFGGEEGVGSRFHVLRSLTHFSAVPRASGLVFMFCVPALIFGGTDGVGSCLNVFAPGHVFSVAEGVGSRFHDLRSRTRFQRYRGRRVPFSCFVPPNTFSAVRRASGIVLMFCAPELIFGGTEGVGSRFHVLGPHTRFRRYHGRRIPFSCFALPNMFLAVRRA